MKMHPNFMVWKKSIPKNLSTSSKGLSIPSSWKTRLLCAAPMLILGRLVGAIIFGFLITNLATERSSVELKCINRGDKVVIWPSHIQEKDVNEMILAKNDICTILESSTYSELTAKLKLNLWKKV